MRHRGVWALGTVAFLTLSIIWLVFWFMQVHPEREIRVDGRVDSVAGLNKDCIAVAVHTVPEDPRGFSTLNLIDVATGKVTQVASGPEHVLNIAGSPDRRSLVAVDGDVRIFDLATLKLRKRVPLATVGLSVAFDSSYLYAGGNNGFVYRVDLMSGKTQAVFDPATPVELPRPDSTLVASLTITPDGREPPIGQQISGVVVWDVRQPRTPLIPCWPTALSVSPDGMQMATAGKWLLTSGICTTGTRSGICGPPFT